MKCPRCATLHGMTASGMLVRFRAPGSSSTDNPLEISHKALVLLGQVRHLVTQVGCKRPVLAARLSLEGKQFFFI